ncbi:MAG: hypothetical protein MN733_32650 [Nitrososphaera sp.]|nr:hypothetical protein [Nitrososphaera sp.]
MAAGESFSISVIKRILFVLDEQGTGIKRTNLAVKTGLNYGTCVKYLNFLHLLRWVVVSDQASWHVSISEVGKVFKQILEADEEETRIGWDSQLPALVQRYAETSRPTVERHPIIQRS